MKSNVVISKRLLLINSISNVLTLAIQATVLVWLNQFLIKKIGAERFSLYPLLMSVMTFMPLVSIVLTSGLSRFIVAAYARGDNEDVTTITSTMLPLLLVAALLFVAIGGLFAVFIDDIFNIPPEQLRDARIMIFVLISALGVSVPLSLFNAGIDVRQKFVLKNMIRLGAELFRIAMLFAFILIFGPRVLWVVLAMVIAQKTGLAVIAIVSYRLLPSMRFSMSHIRWSRIRQLIGFGFWDFIVQLSAVLRNNFDILLLNWFGTPLDVTNYHLGLTVHRKIQQGSFTLSSSMMPALTAMHATGGHDRLGNAYIRGGRIALWGALALAIPIMIYSREFILLYVGNEYIEAATVMALFMSLYIISYPNIMLPKIAYAKGDLRSFSTWTLIMNGSKVVVTWIALKYLGLGAVGAVSVTVGLTLLFHPLVFYPMGMKQAGVSWSRLAHETILPGFLPAVVGAGVWLALRFAVRPDTWTELIACSLGGGAAYLVAMFGFCLQPQDKKDLGRALSGLRSRFA